MKRKNLIFKIPKSHLLGSSIVLQPAFIQPTIACATRKTAFLLKSAIKSLFKEQPKLWQTRTGMRNSKIQKTKLI